MKSINRINLVILLVGCLVITCEKQVFNNPYDPAYQMEKVKGFNGEQVEEHVRLNWEKNNDVKTNYVIERKAQGESDFSLLVDSLSPNTTAYVDSFIITDITYFYRISGYSGKNISEYSEKVQMNTIFPRPSNMTAAQISDSKIELIWQDNSVFEVGFLLDRKSDTEEFRLLTTLDSNVTSFIDESMLMNVSYAYRIKAFTNNNISKYAYSDTQNVLFPAPTNLVATLLSANEISLDWYDNNSFELGFIIERKTEGGNFVQITDVPTNITNYIDFGLIPGIYYSYRIKAIGETIESEYSNTSTSWVGYTFIKYINSGSFDFAYQVHKTTDGGYIIIGYTNPGNSDIWLIKTSPSGTEEWDRTFDINGSSDKGYSVKQTIDGGYILTGTTRLSGFNEDDIWLIKTDPQGFEEWSRTFGQSDHGDGGFSVQQTSDGGFILTGKTNSLYYQEWSSDMFLLKTDPEGNEVWFNVFDGGYGDEGLSVKQTFDSGYIITGIIGSSDTYGDNVWLIKTDNNGDEEWNRIFDGNGYNDTGNSVQQTEDGGYIICGTSNNSSTSGGAWLVKPDVNGVKEWDSIFNFGSGYFVQQTIDGGYILAGSTKNNYASNGWDIWLIKTDNNGTEEWSKTFNGGNDDWGYSVLQTQDGGYIIAGNSWQSGNGDIVIIKTDPEGNVY